MGNIKTILPKLKKGNKYKLGAINFYGNSPAPLPEAYSSIKALLKLMKKNPQMVIQIQGHVNCPICEFGEDYLQKLSEKRAKSISSYLIENDIKKERISTIGFGDKFMLFPHPKNNEEQIQNRRVEIKVISY